jgi:uncharacterized protein (DUF2336 family)
LDWLSAEAVQHRWPECDETKRARAIIREKVTQSSFRDFDGHYACRDLSDSYVHGHLDQGAAEHVRGVYHTNTIERYWPLLMYAQTSLIAELEDAIKDGSKEKRVETLRRVADLFLNSSDQFNAAQIDVFDDVLCYLISRIETRALAELSARLAPIDHAPPEVIQRLARDNEIVVAAPILSQSSRLTSNDLIEIARTKSQAHLLAIAGRGQLEESVTDQLLSRGNSEVAHKLARNAGARFSETGFTTLIKSAEKDEGLAKRIGLRLDLPLRLLRELLLIATEAVRTWLLIHAPSEARDEIQRVLATISNEVSREATTPRDFSAARQLVASMQIRGELNEAALLSFVNGKKYEEMVAALAALCSASLQSIAAVMKSDRNDGTLIACKAAGLKWPTVNAVLKNRFAYHAPPDHELADAKADYLILSQKTALRTLRYWQVRAENH